MVNAFDVARCPPDPGAPKHLAFHWQELWGNTVWNDLTRAEAFENNTLGEVQPVPEWDRNCDFDVVICRTSQWQIFMPERAE
jgi:hypothetical protein